MLTPYPEDLVYGHEAAEAVGAPEHVIRQWASRGDIQRYPGDGRPSGHGHAYRTMYALPEVRARAVKYRPRRSAPQSPATADPATLDRRSTAPVSSATAAPPS